MSNRSTLLDAEKIKQLAKKKGITSRHAFEHAYANKFNKFGEHRAPKFAWDGKRIALRGAREIAELLDVRDYYELEKHENASSWKKLLTGVSDNSFSRFVIEAPNIKGMFSLEEYVLEKSGVQEVSVASRFYLEITGQPQQGIAAFLLSENEMHQLAPLEIPEFEHILQSDNWRYPNRA